MSEENCPACGLINGDHIEYCIIKRMRLYPIKSKPKLEWNQYKVIWQRK